MGRKVSIDQLAEAVNEQLEEYNKLSAEVVKTAVTKAGNAVKKDIGANAPVKTGRYAKSWRTKKTKESSTELEVTVYSPSRYMLGRVRAIPHIAPAQEAAEEQLLADIERGLKNG